MVLVALGVAGGAAVAYALRRRPQVHLFGGSAQLSNGNFAAFKGGLESGTYTHCEKVTDGKVTELDDAECKLVLEEFPEVDVPITARIRMTVGRLL